MPDRFQTLSPGLEAPASDGFAITPHDTNALPEVTRALYVGGAGAISVILASGTSLTLSGIAGGTILPLRLRQVKATGTTATALVGLV